MKNCASHLIIMRHIINIGVNVLGCDRLGRLTVHREGVQMHVKTANVRTFSLDIGRLNLKHQVEALLINGVRVELSSELRFGLVHFYRDSGSRQWQVCVSFMSISEFASRLV